MAAITDPSCPCCKEDGRFTCGGCKNIKYCSAECQQADWPSHRLLCKSFKDLHKRPHPDLRRIIAFPSDEDKPRFMWLPVQQRYGYQTVDSREFMQDAVANYAPVSHHAFTQKPLQHLVNIRYDDDGMTKYSKPNESIINATGGRSSLLWQGPVFAECGTRYSASIEISQVQDMDTRSYADVVAFLIDYHNDSAVNEARKMGKVVGVKANCRGDKHAKGLAQFVKVNIPAHHPIFDSDHAISPISAKVGMPLLTNKYNDVAVYNRVRTGYMENVAVTSMQRKCYLDAKADVSKDTTSFGWPPRFWDKEVGNVLIVRKDRKPLKLSTVAALAAYCQYHLPAYFGWAREREEMAEEEETPDIGSYMQATMDEITPEKWTTFLDQWRQEKNRRAKGNNGKNSKIEEVMIELGRMAMTERDGEKLSNRLFGAKTSEYLLGVQAANDDFGGVDFESDTEEEPENGSF